MESAEAKNKHGKRARAASCVSASDLEEEDVSVDEERSVDEDDGASLADFVVQDSEEEDDDEESEESEAEGGSAAAAEAADDSPEAVALLKAESERLLAASPLKSEVIGGRTLRSRTTLKPVTDPYWERFGKAEAARLEILETKNEQLVELRMWARDGLWTPNASISKRSSAEAVAEEHARACAALGIESSEDEEVEEQEGEDDEDASVDDEEESSSEEDEDEDDTEMGASVAVPAAVPAAVSTTATAAAESSTESTA
jgi:hypothetical protein